jgi:hypothetical protein
MVLRLPFALVLVSALAACVTPPAPGPAGPAVAASGAAPRAPSGQVGTLPSGQAAAASAAPPTAAASQPAGGAAANRLPATPTPTPPQPPFATVTSGAKEIKGTFTLWQKDDKVWIELAEKDFGQPLFLSPKLATGIGEAGLFGGLMQQPQLVEFRRVFNQVQLISVNTAYVAALGTPAARSVKAAFSPSLVASAPLASAPHPDRKSVLVDASALFVGDWLAIGAQLQRTYRQNYAFDARNSALLTVRGKPDAVVFEVQNHYAAQQIVTAQPGQPPGMPGAPVPSAPDTVPDARSLFITLHYSLSRLAAEPMHARAADPRLGHFTSVVSDFGNDLSRTPKRRYVNRWRLEKKEPGEAMSEPVQPITYWLDRDVPEKYRASITAGILEWNKAFEAIGFKNAIVVKQQPDDADFDTLDVGVASVRWMTNASPLFGAIGPSHVDPRSGEILDADIGIESLSSRALRTLRAQVLAVGPGTQAQAEATRGWARLMQASDALAELGAAGSSRARPADLVCEYADFAGEQLGYALDVLSARGDIDPAGPEAEAFVQAYLKDVTMHEVGHTLGLRHNFRASRVYSEQQIDDPVFGQAHALTGSVMEYAPINLPRPGEPGGTPFQTTLGPYDYWAIEYAYRPLVSAEEAAALQRIAARSDEPALAFATDEDNGLGIDPEALIFDLGNDPVAYAAKRVDIARDLLRRLETRPLDEQQDYAVLRRSVSYALRDLGRAVGVAARQIGGVRTLRDFPGTGRDPLLPVPAPRQRAALALLADSVLSERGLALSAGLQRRLAPDYLERGEALRAGDGAVATDYSPQQQLLDLQRATLAQLMSDGVAQRLLDSEDKSSGGSEAPLRLDELYSRLDAEIWRELAAPLGDIAPARRALQREHLNRLTGLLLRPSAFSRADARALVQGQARTLLARLDRARAAAGWRDATRSHLQDCAQMLRDALAAQIVRQTS